MKTIKFFIIFIFGFSLVFNSFDNNYLCINRRDIRSDIINKLLLFNLVEYMKEVINFACLISDRIIVSRNSQSQEEKSKSKGNEDKKRRNETYYYIILLNFYFTTLMMLSQLFVGIFSIRFLKLRNFYLYLFFILIVVPILFKFCYYTPRSGIDIGRIFCTYG